jgi:hypothetical protein
MRDNEQQNDHGNWAGQALVLMVGIGILMAFILSLPPGLDRSRLQRDLYVSCTAAMNKSIIDFTDVQIHDLCVDWQFTLLKTYETEVIDCRQSNRQRDQFVRCLANANLFPLGLRP